MIGFLLYDHNAILTTPVETPAISYNFDLWSIQFGDL